MIPGSNRFKKILHGSVTNPYFLPIIDIEVGNFLYSHYFYIDYLLDKDIGEEKGWEREREREMKISSSPNCGCDSCQAKDHEVLQPFLRVYG